MRPHAACFRMQRGALHVSIAESKNFRSRAGCFHERVIGRHAAIVVQPDALACVVVQLLRTLRRAFGRTITAVPQRDKKIALPIKYDARSEMQARSRFRLHLE